ncbi:MAG: hypothetical protein JOZ49_03945 [Mycolicibacterium sp.]|nr:hypothetical protein [Mycolicibacterium sp.]
MPTGAAGAGVSCGTSVAAVGCPAAEYLATGLLPSVDVTDDDATLGVCIAAVAGRVASTIDTGAESFDTASDVTVEFKGRCAVVPTSVPERDLPPNGTTGVAVAVGAVLDTSDVVSAEADGVRVLVDVVALIWAPPVLTATPGRSDVVVEPVDIELIVDVDVEETEVFEGVGDAAELDAPGVGLAVDERDGEWLTDAEEVDPEDDELDGSAHAIPGLANMTVPIPSATARPPIRATYASHRTRQL